MTKQTYRQSKLMRRFSTLAGPFQRVPEGSDYTVAFKDVSSYDRLVYRNWTKFVAYGALAFVLGLGLVLFQPAHWIIVQQPESPTYVANFIMLICLALLQFFLIVGTLSATRSTTKSKDPVPVRPQKNLRIAFATTRAPGEPVDMVQTTLEAAKRVRYRGGIVDVWLLDETRQPELEAMCARLGVRYFSRAGVARWNTPKPSQTTTQRLIAYLKWIIALARGRKSRLVYEPQPDPFYAAKSKHGNFNSWRDYLKSEEITYDILAGVDTDQVPEPNYLERLLGYFRDPNVAYVVGPQVYGNYAGGLRGLVSRWAESQASFFQSTIQRAGNATTSAMFVGTNYAVRMNVLDQIGGFQPCITEDMATGLAIHSSRNLSTGKRWKSVYTPDVLAVGEGPNLWGPYFTQQWRWAAGTFDTWRRVVWRIFFRLSPGAMLHYLLMLTYYPFAALTWLLGMVSSLTYLTTGATAILAPWSQFVSLYLMALVMQLSLYFWNRRYNVSPHEPEGTYGTAGMLASTLTAPVYFSALVGMALGKKASFVVTTKRGSHNTDNLRVFRTHLQWAAVLIASLIYGFINGHNHPAILVWAGMQLIICLLPVILGLAASSPASRRPRIPSSILINTERYNV